MARSKRHRLESGRARSARDRDRAQLEFDDLLIDQFFTGDDDAEQQRRRAVPVRFGAGRLADFLDDSTIAAAIIRSGDLDEERTATPLDNGECEDLFNDYAPEANFPDDPLHETYSEPAAPAMLRPPIRRPVRRDEDARFSIWGVAQGFLFGTAATVAVLVVLGLIF